MPGRRTSPTAAVTRFVASAADLEENLVLALELDFAVVEPAGKIHGAINADEGVAVEAVQLGSVKLGKFDARL